MATTKKNLAAAIAVTALAAAAAPAASAAQGAVQLLQVTPKRDGFRRAGREWHGTTAVPVTELTAEQYEQLTSEPMLVTQLYEVPADQVGELAASDGNAAGETGT